MRKKLSRRLASGLVMASVSFLVALAPGLNVPVYGDTSPDLKKFNSQVVTEAGCPIEVISATTDVEIDPFGTPVAARHYIDYRNISNRPITAVKFRIGYVSADGKIHQPYLNGDDQHLVQPGAQATQKWRGEKVDPKITAVKVRVLKVKFADGGIWESAKVNDTNAHEQAGYAPLSIETPGNYEGGSDTFMAGAPVPFRDYGQGNYQKFPDRTTTGRVPLTAAPNPGTGATYAPNAFGASGPTSASQPTGAAPGGSPFGGSSAPASAASEASQLDALLGPSPSPAPVPAATAAPPVAPRAAASPVAAPSSAPPAPTAAVPQAAPPASLPASTPVVARPATPAETMNDLDSLLGGAPKAAPAVPPAAAPASQSMSAPAATTGGYLAPSTAGSSANPNGPARAASGPRPGTGAGAEALPLRPPLKPGDASSDRAASDIPAGDGDKPVQLR